MGDFFFLAAAFSDSVAHVQRVLMIFREAATNFATHHPVPRATSDVLLALVCYQLLSLRAVDAHPYAEEDARRDTPITTGAGLARRLSQHREWHFSEMGVRHSHACML